MNGNYLWSADRLPADIDLIVHDANEDILYSSNPGKISPVTGRRCGTLRDSFNGAATERPTMALTATCFSKPNFLPATGL